MFCQIAGQRYYGRDRRTNTAATRDDLKICQSIHRRHSINFLALFSSCSYGIYRMHGFSEGIYTLLDKIYLKYSIFFFNLRGVSKTLYVCTRGTIITELSQFCNKNYIIMRVLTVMYYNYRWTAFRDTSFMIPQKHFRSRNVRHFCAYRIRVRILAHVKKAMVEFAADA